jgi:pimeloyl-ACP methyl ester carboxylesterase
VSDAWLGEITGLSESYVTVNDVRLHYVEAGQSGPLVILLHGFPEFWYSWRRQIPALAEAGFRVIAPDMRGYNLSAKPAGWRAYDAEHLSGDVAELIGSFGQEKAYVVGHDWGAAVAYMTAMRHPEVVERLAILNVPHPARMLAGFRSPRQLRKSWYMFFFQLPWLPEALIRRNEFAFARRDFERDAGEVFSEKDMARYVEAWSQPGAMKGMLDYYRAALRQTPWGALRKMSPIDAETLVIWGERDRYLNVELAQPPKAWVANASVVRIPDASHWVQHDCAERVNELLIAFLKGE